MSALTFSRAAAAGVFLATAACHSAGDRLPGDADDHKPWSGIAATETVRLTGTEPFWGGEVGPGGLVYTTPENPDGEKAAARRFAGRGGVSYSGALAAGAFTLAVTPAPCSDGMSDRSYPYSVTLLIGGQTRRGCGWTKARPFSSAE